MPHIGKEIARREDPDLVTGKSSYLDDLTAPNVGYMAILRSQHAHARLADVDTSAAEQADSVVGVFTAADLEASGVPGTIPVGTSLSGVGSESVTLNRELVVPDRPLLAGDRVRYQGQPVAVVVAEERYAAADAAELIDVEYDRLDAVTHPDDALANDAPQLHAEAPGNLAFDWELGDAEAVDEAFEAADHTVSTTRDHQRVIGNSIEPRGALATYRKGRLSITMSTQIPHMHQTMVARVLGMPESRVHVDVPDIGGGFGIKSKYYPGEVLAGWAAMQVDRPVKWTATRSESFLSDCQGRAHVNEAELAVDDDGSIVALRVDDRKDLGAFLQRGAPAVNTGSFATLLSSMYEVPQVHCRIRGLFTNQVPTDAYRGSSRPEGCFVIERLMDEAARELGMDPAALRQQNMIPADAFPYETPNVATYDSGDYEPAFERLLEMMDYEELRDRQAELREDGRYLGIGITCFVEPAGSSPIGGSELDDSREPAHVESGKVTFYPDGSVVGYVGTSDQGQGHRTTYAQILADELGVDYDDIEIREGDTDHAGSGVGAHSSRSVIMGGSALVESARETVDRARSIAARQLEADPEDVEFEDGEFHVSGAPGRTVDIQTVARHAYEGVNLPAGTDPGLGANSYYASEGTTFPFGCHMAVVEVDPDTGEVDLETYGAVDDCGVQINPTLVEGQIEGGVVQGIGQALLEGAVYDDNGTLVTGSFQDYAMPRAESVPDIHLDETETPSPLNPLGVKGVGEAGTVGSPTAITNAILDALEPFGVETLAMPMTPERVWSALNGEQ
jgi:carbon-monoxide dehydrogenase large subunit